MYDAYGRVIGRSDPATPATGPPELRVGHKGLFFDRLDWGIVDPLTLAETPRLEPGTTLLGYNRNRTLHVGWGRFLQRDPNATGLPVQAGLGFHGEGLGAGVQRFDLGLHYGDGVNVYEYLRSTPLGGSDPAGLFFSFGELMFSSTTAVDIQVDWSQNVAEAGKTLKSTIGSVFTGASMMQVMDAYWASDWSQGDDWYTGAAASGDHFGGTGGGGDGPGQLMAGALPFGKKLADKLVDHHIMTNKNKKYRALFADLFAQRGMNAQDLADVLESKKNLKKVDFLYNNGRHPNRYHDWILETIKKATEGKTGPEAKSAVFSALDKLSKEIHSAPQKLRKWGWP